MQEDRIDKPISSKGARYEQFCENWERHVPSVPYSY